MELILASSSPRRETLLKEHGQHFKVVPPGINEPARSNETPIGYVCKSADWKALAVSKRHPKALVIGADTSVVLDDECLGKPKDQQDAKLLLERLSGKTHCVITGVSFRWAGGNKKESWGTVTRVTFYDLTSETITYYLDTVHTLDKAGAYAIQEHGDLLVQNIYGSLSNVIGLPMEDVNDQIQRLSIPGAKCKATE